MPPSVRALQFGLSNTDNPFEAAILADQLGEHMLRAEPKVSFPPDWVLEHSRGPVDPAVFAVTHCDHVETLIAIARKDRRFNVIRALAANPHLPNSTYNEIIERVTPEQRRTIENQLLVNVVVPIPEGDSVEDLLTDPSSYSSVERRSTLLGAMRRAMALVEKNPDVGTRFLLAASERGDIAPAVSYLAECYSEESEFAGVWSQVSLSPREVVDLYTGAEKVALLKQFLRDLIAAKSQKALVGEDIVSALLASTPTARHFYPKTCGEKRYIYTPEAVQLVISRPEWVALLEGQILSEDDIAVLIKTAPRGTGLSLFALLDGNRSRLERLVKRLEGRSVLLAEPMTEVTENPWIAALACLDDATDELVRRLLVFASDSVILGYIMGTYRNADGTKPWTGVIPSIADVPGLVAEFQKVASGLQHSFAYHRKVDLGIDYVHALIEYAPGLGFSLLDSRAYSKYIFDYLLSSGAGLEAVLDFIDRNGSMSVHDAAAALKV